MLLAAGLVAAWAAMVWNAEDGMVRLDFPDLDTFCLLAAHCLPWVAILVVIVGSRGRLRITAGAVLVIPVLATLVLGPLMLFGSWEFIGAVPVDGGRVAIYRTDCGATCAYGIAVRHERRLFWRVLLVRTLGGFYRAEEARYEALGPRSIRVAVPPYVRLPGNETRSDVYHIKPWVYF